MSLAIAVICAGLAASLMGYGTAVEVTITQVLVLAAYAAGCKIIDWLVWRGPVDRNKPY
jgi:hypothetical protein